MEGSMAHQDGGKKPGFSRRGVLTAGSQIALAGAALAVAEGSGAATGPSRATAYAGTLNMGDRKYHAWVNRKLVPGNYGGVEEVRMLPIADRQVVVRTEACQLCYTNVPQMLGTVDSPPMGFIRRMMPEALPWIMGHGVVGYVEAIGPQVRRVREGDRVIVAITGQCGECYNCVRGRADNCQQIAVPFRKVARLSDGTHAYQDVGGGHAEYSVTLEDNCDGLSAIQGARIRGATRIISVDPIQVRRELALRVGATHVIDPNAEGDRLVSKLQSMCRGEIDNAFGGYPPTTEGEMGADVVIEAVGGDRVPSALEPAPDPTGIKPLEHAWQVCRGGGHVLTTGVGQKGNVSFPAGAWSNSSRTHHSSQYGGTSPQRDIPSYVRLMDAQLYDAKLLITARYSLDQLHEAYRAVGERTTVSAVLRFT
jgi:S-(hydroxymethyl)glutathione dehydrogenase/alcohol dehydrogenase